MVARETAAPAMKIFLAMILLNIKQVYNTYLYSRKKAQKAQNRRPN